MVGDSHFPYWKCLNSLCEKVKKKKKKKTFKRGLVPTSRPA